MKGNGKKLNGLKYESLNQIVNYKKPIHFYDNFELSNEVIINICIL